MFEIAKNTSEVARVLWSPTRDSRREDADGVNDVGARNAKEAKLAENHAWIVKVREVTATLRTIIFGDQHGSRTPKVS